MREYPLPGERTCKQPYALRHAVQEAAANAVERVHPGHVSINWVAQARGHTARARLRARAAGVQLGIEPLHPMFAATRSVVVTVEQSLNMAEPFGPEVGVVIDAYHVWWDPNLYALIDRARGNILGFHVSDWIPLLADPLMSRGMMGDGSIELRRIRAAIDLAGYTGPIEVEIFNEALWRKPVEETVRLCAARFEEHVV